jgi:hypothetical protein
MGDHRTGTTVLCEMLAATECFNPVTVYHVVRRRSLEQDHRDGTVEQARRDVERQLAGQSERGFDRVQVHADTPEEYAFALDQPGYRKQLRPENLSRFLAFCGAVQNTSDAARPLLLKNPWDILNFAYVKQVLPGSPFVFIHRNPVHTINSQIRMMRDLIGRRNAYVALVVDWYRALHDSPARLALARLLYSSSFGLGLRIARRHVQRVTQYILSHIDRIPTRDRIEIRYEDLCREPVATLEGVLERLSLAPRAPVDFAAMVSARETRLLPEVARARSAIESRLRPYMVYAGYARSDGEQQRFPVRPGMDSAHEVESKEESQV